jgi:FtsH-binding integral membrane protein
VGMAPRPVPYKRTGSRSGNGCPALAATLGRVRSVRLAAVLDCCCVLVFVIIGRASHAEGETLPGIASTAWPFLAGLASGWLAARAWRRPLGLVPAGVAAWLGAASLGMVLRVVAGQGTAAAFVFVTLAFLGLFLLGWRLGARLISRAGAGGIRR